MIISLFPARCRTNSRRAIAQCDSALRRESLDELRLDVVTSETVSKKILRRFVT